MKKMVENGSKTLYQALWNSADILRSKMDASEYKNYLLGLVFYKYLSDRMLHYAVELLEEEATNLVSAQEKFSKAFEDEDVREDLIDALKYEYSYVIEPELTFTALVTEINNGEFQLESLAQGFRNIEQASELFENLFEDVDLYSRRLGSTPQKQNQMISSIMKELADLDLSHQGDVLGDAYEYLIGQFAASSGKKAGEFYTPQAVSELMTRIAIDGKEDQKGFTIYDPTMGSGSLMLNAKKYSNESGTIEYFGQELNTSTFNLARMNMILHGVDIANQHLQNGDTLDADWPTDEPTNFDAVLMNPPYSAKWGAEKGFLEDARFSPYGVLAPKSKADFAFLLHGYYHLKDSGVMTIVLPHGVLFRGAAEGKIRKILLENSTIDAVIGLPANIFFNTSIPTTVIVLKKNKEKRDVLFIDASQEFTKEKNQNILEEAHIERILETYRKRENVEKYAHLASFDEIQENDFNLNIPRYVDTFEEEEPISLAEVSKELFEINQSIVEAEKELFSMMQELVGTTDEAQADLEGLLNYFQKVGADNE
ncbi:type I restriction-modification system subunit M [Enterococcus sp.]|uniref:type I restriction-modification system subunit M n=1 Tax=Enterococcus sp. TaxID=35783 RepID=UPI002FCBE336